MSGGRVLVTGATGFVASMVIKNLLTQGRQVIASLRQQSAECYDQPGLTLHCGLNLGAETDWSAALDGVDAVVHCAAHVHQKRTTNSDSLNLYRAVNFDGTVQLARQAATAGVRRFVFLSTIGVHGAESKFRPFCSDDVPRPHSPYAIAKWEAEQALMALSSSSGFSVSVVRPPMVYGPGAPGSFSMLSKAVRYGWPLPLGAVHNRRAFIAVQNLVSLLTCCIDHPAACGKVLLASDGEDLSTSCFLRRMATAQGRAIRLLPVPSGLLRAALRFMGKDGLAQSLLGSLEVDISNTCTLLNWKPPLSVDEGLRRATQPRFS